MVNFLHRSWPCPSFPQSSKWGSSPRTEISDQCQGVIVETFTFSPFSLLQTLGQFLYGNLLHILQGGFHEKNSKVEKHLTTCPLNPAAGRCHWKPSPQGQSVLAECKMVRQTELKNSTWFIVRDAYDSFGGSALWICIHCESGWCVLSEALIVSKLLRQKSIPELAMQHRNFHFQLYVEESGMGKSTSL